MNRSDLELLHKKCSMMASELVTHHDKCAIDDETFIVEECSEVTTELMALIKSVTKRDRGEGNNNQIVDEICDVFAASYIFLKRMHVTDAEILQHMIHKYDRALMEGKFRNNE